MATTCSLCGTPLVPDAHFCAHCGTPVAIAPVAGAGTATGPYERPLADQTPGARSDERGGEWHAEDGGGEDEYYPEDFPDRLSADTGREVMAGAAYPTEPPSAHDPPAYDEAAYDEAAYDEAGYAVGGRPPTGDGFGPGGARGRDEGLGSPWQEEGEDRSRALLLGVGALVGVLVVVGLVYFLIFRPSSSPTAGLPAASSSSAMAPSSATSTPPATSTPSPTTSAPPSSSQPAYPPVRLPAGSSLCPSVTSGAYARVAAGNTATSCEFATAVRAAYVPVADPAGSVTVQASSTRTGKSYAMTCSGNQPVVCGGGNNALVLIFGGAPTAS